MVHNRTQRSQNWLVAAFMVGSSLLLGNCSGKKETTTESTTVGSDSSVFGRQGDTANASLNAPQQAPPDSADRGAVVPVEVKVKAKK